MKTSRSALRCPRIWCSVAATVWAVCLVHPIAWAEQATPRGETTLSAASPWVYRPLHEFHGGKSPHSPYAGLVEGPDGYLYGTSAAGGMDHRGTVYRVDRDGQMEVIDYLDTAKGIYPQHELVLGDDGNLYGTAGTGGLNSTGTVFRVTPQGEHTVLHHFGRNDGHGTGYWPAGLVKASDGNFYGITEFGGARDRGTAFRITPAGDLTYLNDFSDLDGPMHPGDALTEGPDGNFYGTSRGSRSGGGTVFRMTPSGTVTVLYEFGAGGGPISPESGLATGPDGALYGTTRSGGSFNLGTVYKVTLNGTLTIVHSFSGTDGLFRMAR